MNRLENIRDFKVDIMDGSIVMTNLIFFRIKRKLNKS